MDSQRTDIEQESEAAIGHQRSLGGPAVAAVLALMSPWACLGAEPPLAPARAAGVDPPGLVLAVYRAYAASQSRNYDRSQDISPRQLVLLLEVAQRTGTSLGQALATGEHESAQTWNDHVRPTLKNGGLGSATGVWQFQPATFHSIIKKYGRDLLNATGADAAQGLGHLDLGDGPFSDTAVRGLIEETLEARRGPEDEGLQTLRHNFAVLAFAKHYLSLDTGATTPEEDYLFHFLGAGEGRRVLELARGEARDTLCVKPADAAAQPLADAPNPRAEAARRAVFEARAMVPVLPPIAIDPAIDAAMGPVPRSMLGARRDPKAGQVRQLPELRITTIRSNLGAPSRSPVKLGPAVVQSFAFAPPAVSADWGLAADSPTVTGNLGMFYRDGKGQTQPYTWAEFLDNLARRIQADRQPALVRAKYGVGFDLKGGDLQGRSFDPQKVVTTRMFRNRHGQTLRLPEALVIGPLDGDETQFYKQRLAALVDQGDDEPMDGLPPESLAALFQLGLLTEGAQEAQGSHPRVWKALRAFREWVGKAEPDDPANANRLMPAERVALEVYDRRLSRYAAIQACQQASASEAADLAGIPKLPVGLQRIAAPHVALVQGALAAQGLLSQPTERRVWRDKKRKKHVTIKQLPFAGKVDKETIAALDRFQLSHGLHGTDGVLDAVTLERLGLGPMGPEIFSPLAGPQCVLDEGEAILHCGMRTRSPGDRPLDLDRPRLNISIPRGAGPLVDAS